MRAMHQTLTGQPVPLTVPYVQPVPTQQVVLSLLAMPWIVIPVTIRHNLEPLMIRSIAKNVQSHFNQQVEHQLHA